MEKNEADADEHQETGEYWHHLTEPQMISITRKNDEQNQDVDTNSDKVVARNVALVAFQSLAHDLISLHTKVQVDNHEDHEAVYHSEDLLGHDDPVTEAQVGQIVQISYHKELISESILSLGK